MPLWTILTKWPGAVRAAVQVALLGGAAGLLAARRARDVADAGGERREDRVEVLHRPPARRRSSCSSRARGPRRRRWCRRRRSGCPSARAPWRGGCRRRSRSCRRRSAMSPGSSSGSEVGDRRVDDRRRHHQPDGARLRELPHEVGERRRRRSPSPAPAPAPPAATCRRRRTRGRRLHAGGAPCSRPSGPVRSFRVAWRLLPGRLIGREAPRAQRSAVGPAVRLSAIAADQRVGRAVVARASGSAALVELRDDALREHLAELDAPLVERVDVPDRALREDAVLVERDERARARRASAARARSVFDGRLPSNTRCGTSQSGVPSAATSRGRLAERERLGLREHVRDQQVVVAAAAG